MTEPTHRTAMRTALLSSVLTCFFSGSVSAQYWQQLPDMPITNYGGYALHTDVFSGLTGVGIPFANDSIYHFNDNSPTAYWSPGIILPQPPARHGALSVMNGIYPYVIGGMNADSSTYYVDLWRRDWFMQWTALAPLPAQGRAWAVGAVLNDTLYYGLGNNNAPNDWWAYTLVNDTWTPCAPFPGGERQGASCFTANGKVYVGLGASQLNDTVATFHSDWYRYDPGSDSWSALPDMPGPARMQASSFQYNDVGYVFCGAGWDQGNKTALRDGYAYDWLNDQWLTLSLFPGEGMFGGVATYFANSLYGPCIFLGTGGTELNGPGWMPTETSAQWWRYVPGGIAGVADLEDNNLLLRTNGDELITTWSPCDGEVELLLTDALGRQLRAPLHVSGRSGIAVLPISGIATGVMLVEWRTQEQRAVRRVFVE